MIVEDEALVATELEFLLEENGFTIGGWAISSREALEIAAARRPSIALVDIHLRGDDDGVELAQLLRDRFSIEIIFLTAQTDLATVNRARAVEHRAYIRKPYDPAQLLAALGA